MEYSDNGNWLLHDPTMLWFQNTFMDDYLKEWKIRKENCERKRSPWKNVPSGNSSGHIPAMVAEKIKLRSNGEFYRKTLPIKRIDKHIGFQSAFTLKQRDRRLP